MKAFSRLLTMWFLIGLFLFIQDVSAAPYCRPGQPGCVCPRGLSGPGSLTVPWRCFPAFRARVSPLSVAEQKQLRGRSWRPGCPVSPDRLVRVSMPHWGVDGHIYHGSILVARELAGATVMAFEGLYLSRFPMARLAPVDTVGGDDAAAMRANLTSGYNCRWVSYGSFLSQHALGAAIDVNPLWNPQLAPGQPLRDWRKVNGPGVLRPDGPAVRAFERAGWHWGGRWARRRDYQHFSRSGY